MRMAQRSRKYLDAACLGDLLAAELARPANEPLLRTLGDLYEVNSTLQPKARAEAVVKEMRRLHEKGAS
jgi:hypothetical protein